MVRAEITRPPTATRNPAGRVLEVLGRLEDKGVDLKVVMAKYALPDAFPRGGRGGGGRACRSEVRDEDRAGRTDFRPWPTITVDPETARDHDDAISLDRMPQRATGCWRVHIADVAHYVRQGSRARPGGVPARHVRVLSRTASCPCCRTRCRAASAAWSTARTA